MFLTNVLLKKAKSKHILVVIESVASGHKRVILRERLAEKLEKIMFDPYGSRNRYWLRLPMEVVGDRGAEGRLCRYLSTGSRGTLLFFATKRHLK
ncbi:39S ribosomal protein L33, mitochondrial [Anthophora quadrimaculata]